MATITFPSIMGLPTPSVLGNATSDVLNASAWLLIAIGFVLLVLFVGKRLVSLHADVHGMKVSLNTQVKPALGLDPGEKPNQTGSVPFRLASSAEIPQEERKAGTVIERLEFVEQGMAGLQAALSELNATVSRRSQQTARVEAALVAQLGVILPDIPERDPNGRHP